MTREPDLFDAAAEAIAMKTDRPVSQERARVLACDHTPSGPLFDSRDPSHTSKREA